MSHVSRSLYTGACLNNRAIRNQQLLVSAIVSRLKVSSESSITNAMIPVVASS